MRILVVSQYFWPENFRINDLVKAWIHRGHQVTILTGVPNYPSGKVFDAYSQEPNAFSNYEGAKVLRVPMLTRGTGNFRLALNYLSFVCGASIFGPWYLRGTKADVIFVFVASPPSVGLPALLIGKIKKIPVVLWVIDLWPESLVAVGAVKSPLLLGWIGQMVSFIYDRSALVLGQSHSFLKSIGTYCVDKTKIRYFPSWAEEIFVDKSVTPAAEVPRQLNVFTIVFAGNIGEAQDLASVLNAAERLKNNQAIRWIIVGDGRKSQWLQGEVHKRGLEDKVLLAGRFALERMPSFYAHADALLVSLKRDPVLSMTIPGKVQSYLMAGIPLLGMLDGEGANVIRDANAGMTCNAGDSIGLANTVLALASMSIDDRKQLGLNGRRYAQQEFGRTQLIDRLDLLLNEAIDHCKVVV